MVRPCQLLFCSDIFSYVIFCKGDIGSESKRLKGLGIGSHEGPISLDDVRSLQRSNTVYFFLLQIVYLFG